MKKDSKILIIGHNSLTGKALLRRLIKDGFKKVVTVRSENDLIDQVRMRLFFRRNQPEYVFFMDVISGGIAANLERPADFIYKNLEAQNNIIHCAWQAKVKKLLFVASSCVYPKDCPQPMREDRVLTGPLEPTSEAFAVAKIAGIELCRYYNRQHKTDFISAIPATVYGTDDNFDPMESHVIPALIRKFSEAADKGAPSVIIWGSGKPRREFLHVDDMTSAVIFLMTKADTPEVTNIGAGADISIGELAELLKETARFKGKLKFDTRYPDGAYKKLLDVRKLKSLGWTAKVGFRTGLEDLYRWYLELC